MKLKNKTIFCLNKVYSMWEQMQTVAAFMQRRLQLLLVVGVAGTCDFSGQTGI